MRKLSLIGLLLFPFLLFAQSGIPPRPDPPKLYNNLSVSQPDFLNYEEAQSLENRLEAFSDSTSNQIVVVITDDIGGNDINSYATGIGNKWGAGQAKFDNGVVIVVNLGGGTGNRDAYIAVGYGLEGAIPDITAHHIAEEEMIPQFKNGNYAQGINDAVDVVMALARGEINSKDYESNLRDNRPISPIAIGMIIIGIILLFSWLRRRGGGYGGGGFFIGGGGWGRGGGGFGGGGGGFGGFGGGGFGGGGGGGKW